MQLLDKLDRSVIEKLVNEVSMVMSNYVAGKFIYGKVKKGKIRYRNKIGDPVDWIFMYNPAEITDDWSADYTSIKVAGRKLPFLYYRGGQERKIGFDLLLDVTDIGEEDILGKAGLMAFSLLPGDVQQIIEYGGMLLARLTGGSDTRSKILQTALQTFDAFMIGDTVKEGADKYKLIPPPTLQIYMGDYIVADKVKLMSRSIKYMLFDNNGEPLRAMVSMQFSGFEGMI